jgi:hypothetical protein
MSNLSELLPAGAGAKSSDFVASGTLGSGVTVALKADGTVEAVAETVVPDSGGTPANAATGNRSYNSIFVYHEALGKLIYIYLDNNRYVNASVCTLSGTTITFGTPVVARSSTAEALDALYMPNTQSLVLGYKEGNAGYVLAGTATSTTTTWGTGSIQATNSNAPVLAYHSGTGHVITAYSYDDDFDDVHDYKCKAYSVSGTTMTLQSTSSVLFGGSQYLNAFSYDICYDPEINRIFVSALNGPSPFDTGNPSYTIVSYGGSFSVGANAQVSGTTSSYTGIFYDPTSEKIIYSYLPDSSSTTLELGAGTPSTTAITFGSFVNASSAAYGYQELYTNIAHDSSTGKNVIVYAGGSSPYPVYFRSFTVSGTSISLGSEITIDSSTGGPPNRSSITVIPNSQLAISYEDTTDDVRKYSIGQLSYTSTNSADFIGITDQAIADTATGAVIVQGGVSGKVSSLTTGSDYYVQDNGTLSTTVSSVPAGRALSTTSILLEG